MCVRFRIRVPVGGDAFVHLQRMDALPRHVERGSASSIGSRAFVHG